MIKEFQRLKEAENDAEKIEWDAKRFLSKNNYLIQTDAVKNYLIPSGNYKENLEWLAYAEEADVLNVALFGITAAQWRERNPDKSGNIRDYASINELICLSNMENINAVLIADGIPQPERLKKLNQIAISQIKVLSENGNRKLLK